MLSLRQPTTHQYCPCNDYAADSVSRATLCSSLFRDCVGGGRLRPSLRERVLTGVRASQWKSMSDLEWSLSFTPDQHNGRERELYWLPGGLQHTEQVLPCGR